MKLQQQKNGQYQVTLPQDIVKGFGWEKGAELEIRITGAGMLQLKKKTA